MFKMVGRFNTGITSNSIPVLGFDRLADLPPLLTTYCLILKLNCRIEVLLLNPATHRPTCSPRTLSSSSAHSFNIWISSLVYTDPDPSQTYTQAVPLWLGM